MSETVEIVELAAQGDGVTADGVFVPLTLPGETVEILRTGDRGTLRKVAIPSAERATPQCPHFGTCGGCALQHASDGFTAAWKRDLIVRALAQRGIDGVEIAETVTSPPASRRRATFGVRRTRKGTLAGFHAPGSEDLVEITSCVVIRPAILAALPILGALATIGASRKGTLRATVTETDVGLDIAISGGKPIEGPLYGQLVAASAKADLARLSWDGEAVVTRRPPTVTLGAPVQLPPGAFLQATAEGEAVLTEAVTAILSDARRIVDLFAGAGTFTLPLARLADVTAVESDEEAVDALDRAWRRAEGTRQVAAIARDLFRRPLLSAELDRFDGAVIDPPRQGARAQVEHLANSHIATLAMVSCNPATFARDARTLIDGGYRLGGITPVDQFRWSAHVELVARFERT